MDELRALLFGATIAAAIGPIALLIIHNGMRHGLAAALASAAGVAAADFVHAVLAFTAGSQLARLLEHDRPTLALAAAAALIGVGLWLAQDALRTQGATAERTHSRRIGFRGTFLLTLANPLTIALFTAFSGQLALAALEMGNYLIHTPTGEKRIKRIILEDIAAARKSGDIKHAATLKLVLRHYCQEHHV